MVKKLEGKVIEESDEFFVSAKITT
eukprot:COSAG06_NODE_36090_length_451_cov_538.582386_1_plen_24_part_10